MSEWIHFIRPPRAGFAATITDEEKAVRAVPVARPEAEPLPFRVSLLRGRE